jgi:hypothetical protein
MIVGGTATSTAVALSGSPPGWLAVPMTPAGAPRIAVETDTGLAVGPAPVRNSDTVVWFSPGASEFAVAAPDTWPALRAAGIVLQGSLRRAALAWALQGPELARAETDGRVLLWRRDVVDRLGRLAPFADFGEPAPAIADSALWWVSWGYVTSEVFPLARSLPWRDRSVRYMRAGLVGAVRAATGETHVWLAPGYDSLTAAWARHFDPLVEPPQQMPAGLLTQLAYPPELFRLAALQLIRANATSDSDQWTPRPRDPFPVAPAGRTGEVWTALGFEASKPPPSRFVALLAGSVGRSGPSLHLLRPGSLERLPSDLVGSTETSPGDLRIWIAADSVVTLQAQFVQARGAAPRGVAEVYLTFGQRRGNGPTRATALRALVTGEKRAPVDTSRAGRWEQARRLVARADSALAAGNLERFGQIWKDIVRLLAPAPRQR